MLKPISDLCAGDLTDCPVWEYAAEEGLDETYVRPVNVATVPTSCVDQVFHVACDIVTASGRKLTGFMSICNGELHDPDPIIVGANSGDYFCVDHPPGRRDRAAYDAIIGVPFDQLFPLKWQLRVCLGDEYSPRSGVFPGRD